MREFGFELALCATLEAEGHLLARQLGASTRGRRVMDVVLVHPGPEFAARTRITPHRIPDRAITADLGVGRWRYWRDAFDGHPDSARNAMERAVEVGFLESRRRKGRTDVRQAVRYPDWVGGLTGIENKPDLGRPGDLATQLRKDIALGVFDRIVLCTASYVTRAHLNRIPEQVGVWRFDPEAAAYEVIREPMSLETATSGVEVVEEHPGRTDIALVSPERKARLRRRIAERAYGKGWRVSFPDCPHVEEHAIAGVGGLPYCTREERLVGTEDICSCASGDVQEVDLDASRDEHSPWVRDPTGVARRQSGLDRFR